MRTANRTPASGASVPVSSTPSVLLACLLCAACLMCAETASAIETAEPDTADLEELSPEQLFLRASSSALQFAPMLEPSRKILVRRYEESIPYLVTKLDTDDPRERIALEDLFVRIGEPAVPAVLKAFLVEAGREDTTRGARLAATVLGRIGAPSAVATLASASDHRDWKVRGAIGEALGRIGTAGSVQPLVALLSDGDEMVRKSGAVGLGRVAMSAADEDEPDTEARAALNEGVIAALAEALGDHCYAVRFSSADALARIGEPALPVIIELCGNGDGFVRLMAMRAAGGVGSEQAVDVLESALDDPEWVVRAHAAMALGAIGPDGRARRSLERLAGSDAHPLVVAAARNALALGG